MASEPELTPEVLDAKLNFLTSRGVNPSERQATVDWIVKLFHTGEIRDLDPGFSAEFYPLFFKLISFCLAETVDSTIEAPLPDENPLPTDAGVSLVSTGNEASSQSVSGPGAVRVPRPSGPSTSMMTKVGVASVPKPARGNLTGSMATKMPGFGAPAMSAHALGGVTPVTPFDWDKFLDSVSFLFGKLTALTEFDADLAVASVTPYLLKFAMAKLWQTTRPTEQQFLKAVLHWVYKTSTSHRPLIRHLIGDVLLRYGRTPRITTAVQTTLELLGCIVRGFGPHTKAHNDLLEHVLLPLHDTNSFLNETTPLISLYHEQLVFCLVAFIQQDARKLAVIIRSLLASWPSGFASNSPKEVLLLHEVEQLIEAGDQASFDAVLGSLLPILIHCCSSENSRVAQRALQMFASDKFSSFCHAHSARIVSSLMPVLLRSGELHWNISVNKMTHKLLSVLRDMDRDCFVATAQTLWGGRHAEGSSGIERVDAYMSSLVPVTEELSPAEKEKMTLAPTPTLLPDLMFHDLVFGHELGSGSFSTVKYAKLIVRGKPASAWPEYAVKVISTDLIRRLGYEASVQRELAILRLLGHPGLARLVASFRWREGAYFVLEYASRGDLHTQITKIGSLDEPCTRFVIGEVVSALASIHAAGFVYGDLKPENIVLTSSGHAKLTDFGAVRPFTDAAKRLVEESKDSLRSLRDGDWKVGLGLAAASAPEDVPMDGTGADGAEHREDTLEGTAVYLAPEVIKGEATSVASDCWALGCVVYQCLTGRPPVWADSQVEVMDKIVSFQCEKHFPADFPELAKDLVMKLLDPDPKTRLGAGVGGLAAVKQHPFFGSLPVDELYQHTPPPMAQGSAAPAPDAGWSRRQNSIMWAPMPTKYTFKQDKFVTAAVPETPTEANASFLPFGFVPEHV